MPVSYQHTQIGYVTIAALGAGIAVLGYMSTAGPNMAAVLVLFILAVALVLFATLTTIVERGVLEVRFGPGVIRRRVNLNDIREVRVVRNPWHCGWGIHWIGRGWLWNVSGLRAVELELRDGRRFRIGSDEPEPLAQALGQP
jgi:hypothetical protein